MRAEGNVMFWNKVYDGAMGWTGELSKFGAHVFSSDPHRVVTFGGKPLVARGGGEPLHHPRGHRAVDGGRPASRAARRSATPTPIRRAHPRFAENLRSLGVQVEWTSEE